MRILGDIITVMDTPIRAAALQKMKPLCRPLHAALRYGAESAAEVMEERSLADPEHSWLRYHFARVQAGMHLRRNHAEIAPWKVLRGQKTGSLQLVSGGATLRVLRPMDGGLPIPGRNHARRSFYIQPTITGLPVAEALPELEISNFIAVWDILNPDSFEVGIQVFRTVGTFELGDPSRADLTFWLPGEPDELDNLAFEPSDEGIDLPIPQEDSDDDTVHG